MSKSIKLGQNILSSIPLIIFILIVVIWFNYYSLGFSYFNKSNAVSIFGSVIQGMSALLSVAIAVIIFRIQSLENRNLSLEQSTLNYIHEITKWTYPQWISSVEEDIKKGSITERYRLLRRTTEEERNSQQKRLEETLNRHTRIEQTIQRTRDGVILSVVFLILPILFSFLLLMVSDALDSSYNFVFVSIVVLMSAIGIALLIKTVLESTVQSDKS